MGISCTKIPELMDTIWKTVVLNVIKGHGGMDKLKNAFYQEEKISAL